MAKFYIEKLEVKGDSKESSVSFNEGVNFIIGSSNTGKTTIIKCINYIFGFKPKKGGEQFDFDGEIGYDRIILTLRTKRGMVALSRKLDESSVTLSGTDTDFEHGQYSLSSSAKKSLNSVWLKLIGIGDNHKILGTLKGGLHQITLRAMLHMFLIQQTEIARTSPVLLNPKTWYNDTASKALLLFLMSGRDADHKESPEHKKVRKAKRLAVIEYIKDSIGKLVQREGGLLKQHNENNLNMDNEIVVVKTEMSNLQAQISTSLSKSKDLMDKIYSHNSKLSECNTISERFTALRSQYHSDVKRLTFIIEGRINQEGQPKNVVCPFCDGEIVEENSESYIEMARAELTHIRLHLVELLKAEKDVATQRTSLEEAVTKLESEKREVDTIITKDLTPRLNALNERLGNYRQAVELSKELEFIQNEEKRLSEEATSMEKEKDAPNERYDIVQYFDDDLMFAFNENLKTILKACHYEGHASARLSLRETFDLEVGGKNKSMIAGGGYCGFLNTIVALALIEFLETSGKYSPGFLIADSPLSQLSEPEREESLNTKKAGFFNYLLSSNIKSDSKDFQPQIIIAEHPEKLPFSLDNHPNVNLIEFTRTKDKGRYGFLEGVYNREDE